jgi:hypothetical protein
MLKTFSDIYENKCWGDNKHNDYAGSSGCGSAIDYNKNTYVPFLRDFIKKNNIQSVIDLGCGDFRCGPLIYNDLNIKYIGYDAYQKVVDYNNRLTGYTFKCLDIFSQRDQLEPADLIILKDVLQHWGLKEIHLFLDHLVSSQKYKYILITNCSKGAIDNQDIPTGGFRPLSCSKLPMRKYNPRLIYNYDTKEVSCIFNGAILNTV